MVPRKPTAAPRLVHALVRLAPRGLDQKRPAGAQGELGAPRGWPRDLTQSSPGGGQPPGGTFRGRATHPATQAVPEFH